MQLFHASASSGVEDDPIHYPLRPQGLARAIEFTVASIRHGIVVELPNQYKNKFMPGGSPFTSDVTLRVSGRPVL